MPLQRRSVSTGNLGQGSPTNRRHTSPSGLSGPSGLSRSSTSPALGLQRKSAPAMHFQNGHLKRSASRASYIAYEAAHAAASASWYIPKISDEECPGKGHAPVLSPAEVSAMVQRVTRGGEARQLRKRRLKLKGAQKSHNVNEPEKRSNPFVEFEDREKRLQNERRWLQEDPLYMAERYAGVRTESVQQRLKKLMTAPSDLYDFVVFYSTYAVQMKVLLVWRNEMKRLKATAKGIAASKRDLLIGIVGAQKHDQEGQPVEGSLVGAVQGMAARVAGMGFAMARIAEVKTKAQITLHNRDIEAQAVEEKGKTRHGRGHRDEKINLHATHCKMLQQMLADSEHKLDNACAEREGIAPPAARTTTQHVK